MKKFFLFIILFCFPSLLFAGCKSQTPPPYNLATGICITCQHKDILIRRNYTSQEKMKAVLTYLRVIKPRRLAQTDPVSLNKDIYKIQVQLSDGNTHIYQQTAHRYFKGHGRPWMHIPAEDAKGLYDILSRYESDPDVAVITSEEKL